MMEILFYYFWKIISYERKRASQFLGCLALLFIIDCLQMIKISVFGFYGDIINIGKIFDDIFTKYR